MGKEEKKKPFYKKFWFWAGAFIIFGWIVGITSEDEEEVAEKEAKQEQVKQEREDKKVAKEKEKPKAVKVDEKEEAASEEKEEPSDEWDDVKEKDKIIGKSNKDFSEAAKNKPSDVRNDKTGNWKITKISENINVEDYALSYYDLYMEDDEIHFIVNFNYSTTSNLSYMNGLLYLDIHEYVKKEERDASTLGSGMLLKSYVIYPDGVIQELDEI